jgi:hypothetical protein
MGRDHYRASNLRQKPAALQNMTKTSQTQHPGVQISQKPNQIASWGGPRPQGAVGTHRGCDQTQGCAPTRPEKRAASPKHGPKASSRHSRGVLIPQKDPNYGEGVRTGRSGRNAGLRRPYVIIMAHQVSGGGRRQNRADRPQIRRRGPIRGPRRPEDGGGGWLRPFLTCLAEYPAFWCGPKCESGVTPSPPALGFSVILS